MRTPPPDLPQTCEEIQALRRVIAQTAGRCGIDLADRKTLRALLDGDFSECRAAGPHPRNCQELSTMLTLLYRLEASSSEDLGIAGLRRLWREHGMILARFASRQAIGETPQLAAS